MTPKFTVRGDQVIVQRGDQSVNLTRIINEAETGSIRFTLRHIPTARSRNNFAVGLEAGTAKGLSQEERTRAFLAVTDALTEAGFPRSVNGQDCVRYSNSRPPRGGGNGPWEANETVWLDLGALMDQGTGASGGSAFNADAALVEASLAYFEAGGTENPPQTLPVAAQVGWYKAQAAKLNASTDAPEPETMDSQEEPEVEVQDDEDVVEV